MAKRELAVRDPAAEPINDAHRKAEARGRDFVQAAAECGRLLSEQHTAMKIEGRHGEWEAWVEENCEFSLQTARTYRQIAKYAVELPNRQSPGVLPSSLESVLRDARQQSRKAKEEIRENRRDTNRQRVAETQSLADLDGVFATIVVDPPWDWGDEGDVDQLGRARPTYSTMPVEDIEAVPIGDKADVDAHLYLWITNRSLPKGFGLLEAWGFRYVTCLTWVKPHFGMGNYFRGQTEHVLFGVKGSQPLKRKDVSTSFSADRGKDGHSSKPDAFYELIESCSPGPYLDVFSRRKRKGWISWGADVD